MRVAASPRRERIAGSPVDWTAVGATVRALAETAPRGGRQAFERLARAAVDPLVRLEQAAILARRAAGGDHHAARALARLLDDTAVAIRSARQMSEQPARAGDGARLVDGGVPGVGGVLDEPALVSLVATVAEQQAERSALEAVMVLVRAAEPIDTLSRAYAGGGPSVMLGELRAIAAAGRFPEMRSMLDFDASGDLPGVDWADDLLEDLLRPDRWREEWWEPIPHWWVIDPPVYDPPPGLSCLETVSRLMSERAAIPPPTPPPGALFADQITSLETAGACPEDRLRIYGSGFAALRESAALVLPTQSGCHPVSVAARNWTETSITLSLPYDVASGPVGFVDRTFVEEYRAWEADQAKRLEALKQYPCFVDDGTLSAARPFNYCAPDLGRNHLRAGVPVIAAFTLNGDQHTFVEPGGHLTLAWTTQNTEHIRVERVSAGGPRFAGADVIENPPVSTYALGPFASVLPQTATYALTATGPCGEARAEVTATVTKVPNLTVEGAEFTQAVQVIDQAGVPSCELVASKDTIARVRVVHDLAPFILGDFGRVPISGELRIAGRVIRPVNGGRAVAREPGRLNRGETHDTLNFRIPAALATGQGVMVVRVWTAAEHAQPPDGSLVRPWTQETLTATWTQRRALKLRFVRVSTPTTPAMTPVQARLAVVRAFDLLPSPPQDVAPARLPTWHTTARVDTDDGKTTLLDQIEDQHDCAFTEWLLPWTDDCPDDDGAIWIGIGTTIHGGRAERSRGSESDRNTIVANADRLVIAHELGHTMKLHHVNPKIGCPDKPNPPYDPMERDGAIRVGDAFDARAVAVVKAGTGGLWDLMTYACTKWVSRDSWRRMAGKL